MNSYISLFLESASLGENGGGGRTALRAALGIEIISMSRSLKILRKQLEELVCLYGSWLSCSHCLYRSRKFSDRFAVRSTIQVRVALDHIVGFVCCSYHSILGCKPRAVPGKYLAEHCRKAYSRVSNFILWILAEIATVACDIPEVIGTAFALIMLFKIPL
ncbi:uncharacterized protein LOC142549316 isoform X1 [Primulina tabacum]|uniref:uncharacterized protein LOC142549316 isoform X1 n=1 Tax=Primulina tabacum TaxID=48773 RepID=UPI003F59A35B